MTAALQGQKCGAASARSELCMRLKRAEAHGRLEAVWAGRDARQKREAKGRIRFRNSQGGSECVEPHQSSHSSLVAGGSAGTATVNGRSPCLRTSASTASGRGPTGPSAASAPPPPGAKGGGCPGAGAGAGQRRTVRVTPWGPVSRRIRFRWKRPWKRAGVRCQL